MPRPHMQRSGRSAGFAPVLRERERESERERAHPRARERECVYVYVCVCVCVCACVRARARARVRILSIVPTGRRSFAYSWRRPFYTRRQSITAHAGVDSKRAGRLPRLAHRHEPTHAVAATCASRRLRRSRTNLISETSDRSCSPGADVAGVSPVPVQMWRGRAQSRCRCGRGGWLRLA